VRAVRGVLAAGFALLLLAIALTLARSEPRSAGANQVAELEEVVNLDGARRHCQDGEIVPGDAASVRLLLGTHAGPSPELRLTVREGGQLVTSGRRPAGGPKGRVEIPVRPVGETTGPVTLCIVAGGGGSTVLYGLAGRVRLEWMRAGSESWFELLPVVAHRFGLAKANPLGSLLLPFAALILVAAWFAAARLLLREMAG
jgi:hypothetical protein